MPANTKPLNDKQEAFCREYVLDSNGTQAAIRAGYSAKTAQVQSHALLLKPIVQQRCAELRKPIEDKCELTAEWILRRLMDEAQNHERGNARVKALELLARTKGMLIDRVITETKPLYDDTTYELLIAAETIDAYPVRQVCEPRLLPDAAARTVPRNGFVELPPPAGTGTPAD